MAGDTVSWHGASMGAWFMTVIIIAGTIVGGIALIYWNWTMFWVGVGLFVVGCLGGYFTNIMGAVSEYAPAPSDSSTP
jgi:hypothetical protein